MTGTTRQQLQIMVDAIAAHAHVAPPRVKLWRYRNARYSALTHTIAVSKTLACTLDAPQLYTLLAHEVGHAKRRAMILKRPVGYIWPPMLALMIGAGAAAAVIGSATTSMAVTDPQALCALALMVGAGLVGAQFVGHSESRARRDGYAEELRADRFANRLAGNPAAMTSVLHACARIEDESELTLEAQRRIAFAQRSYGRRAELPRV
ncbi:M48 family metalloprotease (plasmid) [Xanthomonas translucens pv. translucens]|uniref:M48 family metalloprotease n=1 Tax=Xanthomonas campestris pv. translucens TaxID=343 RepID=UPI0021BA4886|nr:M48 family metalloprotease [Xanthomonas translucens]MCT8308738.1 M48 family metalloprotease [Xanthomonas translucens pv. translucens]WNJ25319.1 M48 family metalloprotease [Xanthomonas translucens pv. translucens]WNJ25365.1 M48 family metalloprotease [Xanthomonas translucens pv. translucens]